MERLVTLFFEIIWQLQNINKSIIIEFVRKLYKMQNLTLVIQLLFIKKTSHKQMHTIFKKLRIEE